MSKFSIATFLSIILFIGETQTAEFRNPEYCQMLGEVGKNTYIAKEDGHSLYDVLQAVQNIFGNDEQNRTMVTGVVTVIFGDDSISSSADAFNVVYNSCKR
jgi:hypothetical protein